MTIAFWCVLFTAFLPLVWAGLAKSGADPFDNARPRASLAKLTGAAQRADWAQANAYEAFPPFAAGVIIAHLAGAQQWIIDTLAIAFLVLRLVHGIAYVRDLAMFRSLVWTAGFLCMVGLFLAGGYAD